MTPAYCHHTPRCTSVAACAVLRAEHKRAQNRRSVAKFRQRQRERRAAEKQQAEATRKRIDAQAVATLQEARAVLLEHDDEAHRLTPPQVVMKWNIVKDRIYKVTI